MQAASGKVIIVGSGPAGISAALYLQRSGKVAVTVFSSGSGALEKAGKIENYYGFAEPISGKELHQQGVLNAKRLGVSFIEEEVFAVTYDDRFKPAVQTKNGTYSCDAVLLATGTSRKAPSIPGLRELEGKGVSYCAVCDAFFYTGKDVAVIGSGEYAVHEAQILAPVAASVTILTNGSPLSAELPSGIDLCTEPLSSVNGESGVSSVTLQSGDTIPVSGVFVAIGVAGSTDLARKVGVEINGSYIKVNAQMETSVPALYAAGDCTGGTLQLHKAVHEGAVAASSILRFLF